MNARHVAFYMHDLSGGGVERMRLALIGELQSRGVEVSLIVGARTGALASLVPADLRVIELERTGMLQAVRPLARVLRVIRPDVLVASLDHNNVTAMLARLVSRSPVRVVICQHNALSAERALGWRYRAVPWLYWLLQGCAHGIVAVSHGVAGDLATVAGFARARVTTIHNPVVGPDFALRAAGDAPHDWLRGPCPTFVFAGRLTEQKDPATALRALAVLRAHCPARMLVLGDGPLRTMLEAEVLALGLAEHVAFAGFQANPLPWIRHACALVSSSRYEGLGNAIIEALACGTPVISTDCPHGPSEILLDGAIGYLVPVADPAAMARAMQACVERRPKPEPLMARAAAFTTGACAQAHQALFDRLLDPGPRVQALGMAVSPDSAKRIVHRILAEPAHRHVSLVVTPNLDHVRLLRRTDFRAAYDAAEIVCPDGFPVLLYARLRGLKLSSRVTGCELFALLARDTRLASQRMCLVLESEQTARAVRDWSAAKRLAECVTTFVAPPGLLADAAAQAAMLAAIREASPTILVMTLGAPQSEILVHRHRDALPPCWALCVGQAVRIELGLTARAPAFWQRMGLEWLWRARQEPRRLIRRYMRALLWFPAAILQDMRPRSRL